MKTYASADFQRDALQHIFGLVKTPRPSSIELGLHASNPGTTGAGELSGNGYSRKTFDDWADAVAGKIASASTPQFQSNGPDWATAIAWALYLDGQFALGADLKNPITVTSTGYTVAPGQLTAALTKAFGEGVAGKYLTHVLNANGAEWDPTGEDRYVSLNAALPDFSQGGSGHNEVATPGTAGYARSAINGEWELDADGAASCYNTAELNFTAVGADLALARKVAVWDHPTSQAAANLVGFGSISLGVTIYAGGQMRVLPGAITASLAPKVAA